MGGKKQEAGEGGPPARGLASCNSFEIVNGEAHTKPLSHMQFVQLFPWILRVLTEQHRVNYPCLASRRGGFSRFSAVILGSVRLCFCFNWANVCNNLGADSFRTFWCFSSSQQEAILCEAVAHGSCCCCCGHSQFFVRAASSQSRLPSCRARGCSVREHVANLFILAFERLPHDAVQLAFHPKLERCRTCLIFCCTQQKLTAVSPPAAVTASHTAPQFLILYIKNFSAFIAADF